MDFNKLKLKFEPKEEEDKWASLKTKFEPTEKPIEKLIEKPTESIINFESLKAKFEPTIDDITTPAPKPTKPPLGADKVVSGAVVPPKPVQKLGLGEGISVIGGTIKQLPQQIKAAVLQVTQGAKGASVANKDWADEYIKTATEEQAKFAQETIDKYGDISFLGIKLSDIANMPQSIAFSLTSMGAGLAVGVPTALVPIPGSRILAWGAGTYASGKAAYEMSAYQIMQIYLDAKNEEKMAISKQGLTLEEENNLKQGFNNLAKQYALWEAIPEAISNLAFVGLLTAPLTKMVGKTIAGKIVNKLAAMYGEELLTETITEIGQKGVMGKAGLPGGGEVDWKSPTEWVEAFKAVAPQTFLLTTIMGGTGTLAINTSKVVKSFNKEAKDSPVKEKLKEKIENKEVLQEAVKEEPTPTTEKVAEVEPILPVTGKGKVSKIAKSIEEKSIEQGLTKGFGHLAEYTPIVIREQAKRASDLINTNIDEARRIIRGEKPLPEGLKGTALITAMEEHIKNTANGELASELASSPLVSGTSAAAQELRLAAERDPASPVKAIEDINKELQKTAERKLPGKILGKAKTDTVSKIKNNIKNANTAYSWKTFIESIRC